MYIPTLNLLESLIHKKLTLSLYRSLLRNLADLKTTEPIPETLAHKHELGPNLRKEVKKIAIDSKLYKEHILFEILYGVKHEFRTPVEINAYTGNILRKRLLSGTQLDETLTRLTHKDNIVYSWIDLIQIIVDYRSTKHQEQIRKFDKDSKFSLLNEVRNKRKDPLFIKRVDSKLNRRNSSRVMYHTLSSKEKERFLRDQRHESHSNSSSLLRRYLKKLQTDMDIPNPFLLSYTPNNYHAPPDAMFSSADIIPGSTKHSVMESAYDMDYIDSIIKPSLEYDINKYHFLDALNNIVNEKGPYKVKMAVNNSGSVPIPLMRYPNQKLGKLTKLALNIRRLNHLTNMKNAWESKGGDPPTHGQIFKDGSYAIKYSRGFGFEERMFPKQYYADLSIAEAEWEFLIDNATKDNTSDGKTPEGNGPLSKSNVNRKGTRSKDFYIKEWMQPLSDVSNVLQEKIDSIHQKHKVTESLLKEQSFLQNMQNIHYNRQAKKLKVLLNDLQRNNVFKHSEIGNFNDRVLKTFDVYLNNYKPVDRTKRNKFPIGIPMLERKGMGKNLGDYIDEIQFHNFKWGKRFSKRIKF